MTHAPLITRAEFIRRVRTAAQDGEGFAAGKIGNSEQFQLYHPILAANHRSPRQRRAAALVLDYHGTRQSGIFPGGPDFLARYLDFYTPRLRMLDVLGLFDTPAEPAIIAYHRLEGPACNFMDQEPGRGTPDDPADCYLPGFAGKRLLIISPFANLLAERATASVFEAVWAKTGKRWFAPASVDALVMPYGWARDTQQRFADSIALFDHLCTEMSKRRFDLALISAGGLGIPLAVQAKAMGAVGISLGGHLQVLFGVLGSRWREDPEWQQRYINADWIDLPEVLQPETPRHMLVDRGAYW